jgi:hypothetical protein
VAAAGISGVASADTIVGYNISIGTTSTDITSLVNSLLPGFDPGSSNTMVSNVPAAGGNPYTTGISMNSLNPSLFNYTLIGFNIAVKETLTGTYTITNTSTNSAATGTAYVDSYTAVSLGSPLTPPLTNSADPTNDLFNCSVTGTGIKPPCASQGEQITSTGGGPDPNGPLSSNINIPDDGGTFTPASAMNVNSSWVDYGCEVSAQQFCTDTAANKGYGNELLTGQIPLSVLANILGTNLNAYFSTATQTDSSLTGGNNSTTYDTMVQEQVTVTYDYTATSVSQTPEPSTMALLGGALVGLGLIGKRLRKS